MPGARKGPPDFSPSQLERSIVIQPSIGRRVWYRPAVHEAVAVYDRAQALDAGIVYVWNDRMVNLLVTDHAGQTHIRTSVTLLQDDDAPANSTGGYAEWMPYQKGQKA